jgi:hypothetical protein
MQQSVAQGVRPMGRVVDDDAFMGSRHCRVLTSACVRIESDAPGGDHGQ